MSSYNKILPMDNYEDEDKKNANQLTCILMHKLLDCCHVYTYTFILLQEYHYVLLLVIMKNAILIERFVEKGYVHLS